MTRDNWPKHITGQDVPLSEPLDCPFCAIISGTAPGLTPVRWEDAVVIEPLHPVTDGHVLIVPRQHVRDATENQHITALTMRRAAQYLQLEPWPGVHPLQAANIITSIGAEATQTVMHLHLHIIPRREGDGLLLPWSNQEVE